MLRVGEAADLSVTCPVLNLRASLPGQRVWEYFSTGHTVSVGAVCWAALQRVPAVMHGKDVRSR